MSNMDLMSASVQQLEPLRPSSTSPVKDDASWKEEVEERAQRGIESTNCECFITCTGGKRSGEGGYGYRECDLLSMVNLLTSLSE